MSDTSEPENERPVPFIARVIGKGKLTIPKNVRDLLDSVSAIADDVRLFASGHAGSTVLLEGISISGT